ncbi:hypothetical protein PHLGIDRAFT_35907 [Phlebiopsis gigantea 11061_1 CR5-6]|uniref:Histone chaperone domain-containing protein n=1 Tax=Phlebiopsis gigantea (strain 11061_1 CR5-6) TaxID=745531 RepID=A0A0C3PJV6_PHLG1|nr:hypothetical protein PHLGIDRAFT_35907 [Phlebiopsis gigantea 11061_1 CR5-6]
MSTAANSVSNMNVTNQNAPETVADKGKGKIIQDESMTEDDEDDEEEEEEEDEDEEMAEEESMDEIDPSVIQPRRTRGVRVDYTSAEALAKAGVKPEDAADDDEQEETYNAKDEDEMRDD